MKQHIIFFLLIVILYGCQKTEINKFVLFSDTHVSELGTGTADLRLAVADVNSQPDIDLVLVSGDITDTNTGENLATAKRILDSLHVPYYIIPGNHDTKWSGSAGANFREFWGDDKFSFTYNGICFIGFHQGPVLRMDDGHIPRHVLTWLTTELKQIGPDQPIILVMHYALNPSVDNWHECIDIIQDYNIKAIIHGHGHRNRQDSYQGIPAIMGRSTLRAGAERGGYTLFTLHDDSLFAREKTVSGKLSKTWAEISLANKIEIDAVADSLLPDVTVNTLYPYVRRNWQFSSGYLMTASPVCDDQRLYVGDVSGTMYALSLDDGSVIWKNSGAGSIYGTAAISEDRIVYTAADSLLHCLDKFDGKFMWSLKTGNTLVSVPIIEDDVIYFGGSDGNFRAVDIYHGEIIWEFSNVGGYVETKPVLFQDKVIFGAWDATLYALDQISGRKMWTWQGERTNPLYSPAACWPVAANNTVFIAAPDRYLTAIDATDGHTVWRDNRLKFRETVGLSKDSKQVFARSMTDSVISFDSSSKTPKALWAEDYRYGYDIAPSMPMEKEGVLYWGTKNGLLIAANAQNGQLLWKHQYQNYLINTVFPLDAQSVVFSNIDGNVVQLVWEKQ
jgi:outer membrane protein assembly factor BamB